MDWYILLGLGFGLVTLCLRRRQVTTVEDDEAEALVFQGSPAACRRRVDRLADAGIPAWLDRRDERCHVAIAAADRDAAEETLLPESGPARSIVLGLLLVVFIGPSLGAASAVQNEILSDDEVEARYIERRQEKAADYRLAREAAQQHLDEAHHAEAAALAEHIDRLMEQGEVFVARRRIEAAQRSHGYSRSAGRYQHQLFRVFLSVGDLRRAKIALVDLAERFTDYPQIDLATREALLVARKMQAEGELINLQADSPREVINSDASRHLFKTDRIFRYLADPTNSDRDIAPEAALLYARSLLARGYSSKERLVETRIAYEYLLTEFPESPYIFEALCELAVTHLLVYRGDKYDVGALITAAGLIKRARNYIDDDPQREDIIEQYEQMILRWHQDRDLQVALWYRKEGRVEAARYYFKQAEAHDPASATGLRASRALANLPPPPELQEEAIAPTGDGDGDEAAAGPVGPPPPAR